MSPKNPTDFPAFARKLPEADLPYPGMRGWLLQTDKGQYLFNEAISEVKIPPHTHADQSGVVVAGTIDLILNNQTKTYNQGDTYFIPKGLVHQAILHPGFKAIDYFAEPNRYRPKIKK